MNTFMHLAAASSLTVFIAPWVFAQATTQGDGTVLLGGQVVDSACGLEVTTVDQTIEMAPEPIGRLLRYGQGNTQPFELRLVNCSLTRPAPSRPGQNLPD